MKQYPRRSSGQDSAKRPLRERKIQVRMSDVARYAGVGLGTVSRVLNGSVHVSEETRNRVLAAIAELGYVPNLVARSLVSRRTGVVAAIIPTIDHSQHAEVVQGMSEILGRHDIHLMVSPSSSSWVPEESLDAPKVREEKLVAGFLARRPDAIYLTGADHTDTTRKLLQESGISVVEGCNMTAAPIDLVVGYSNLDAGKAITRLLLSKGYRHIAAVVLSPRSDRGEDRLKGYRAALAEAGRHVQERHVLRVNNRFDDGARAISRILEEAPEVDAVFFASDVTAVGAIMECQRRKVKVPKRIAIAGFDDLPIASTIIPRLTTVRIQTREIGRQVGAMLLRRMAGKKIEQPIVNVGFEIIEREST